MSEEKDYDVVLDVLQKYADQLWKITESNMAANYSAWASWTTYA